MTPNHFLLLTALSQLSESRQSRFTGSTPVGRKIALCAGLGLGAELRTSTLEGTTALAPDIEAGAVFINAMVASNPRLPFGAITNSGYGRDLCVWGQREFANIKTVLDGLIRQRGVTWVCDSWNIS